MKMLIWGFAAVAGLVLAGGCGTTAHVVDTQSGAARITTVNNVDPQDWESIVVAGVNDLLASGALAEYREVYGEKPLVMVSTIRNDSKQHLNTALLTERITEAILNSRQARVTSAVALDANVDKAIPNTI